MSHTTVLHEVLVDGSVAPGDVRLHHNGDFSGISDLQVTGPDGVLFHAPLEESVARLVAAGPEMLDLLRQLAHQAARIDPNHRRVVAARALLKRIDGAEPATGIEPAASPIPRERSSS